VCAGVPYELKVFTGDRDGASTDAKVYCVLYGGRGGDQSSGKIWLQGGKFKRARTDIFNVEVAETLSPLSRIEIGHDNSGPGSGWFLDKVSTVLHIIFPALLASPIFYSILSHHPFPLQFSLFSATSSLEG
jgi:hypothetical protein